MIGLSALYFFLCRKSSSCSWPQSVVCNTGSAPVSNRSEKQKAPGSILKMAAAKHYLDTVRVLNITIPNTKTQDSDKQAKNNWLRDDAIRAHEEECKRTYIPKKYTKYAGKELLYHTGGYKLLFILHTGLWVDEALALTWVL